MKKSQTKIDLNPTTETLVAVHTRVVLKEKKIAEFLRQKIKDNLQLCL